MNFPAVIEAQHLGLCQEIYRRPKYGLKELEFNELPLCQKSVNLGL